MKLTLRQQLTQFAHLLQSDAQLRRICRLHRQRTMSLPDMLKELPQDCSIGAKTNSQGYTQHWRGYKLHWDVADGQIPISAVLTGAKVHDSQVAIPLMTMSSQRVTHCYELMDAAYDAGHILEHSRQLGHVPIVDPVQRIDPKKSLVPPENPSRQLSWAEEERYKERTMVERVNGRLKDEFGGAGCACMGCGEGYGAPDVRGAGAYRRSDPKATSVRPADLSTDSPHIPREQTSRISWRVLQVVHKYFTIKFALNSTAWRIRFLSLVDARGNVELKGTAALLTVVYSENARRTDYNRRFRLVVISCL